MSQENVDLVARRHGVLRAGGIQRVRRQVDGGVRRIEQRTEEVIEAGDQDVVSIISQRGRPRGSQSWAISGSASSGRWPRGN
jgi:hypothetical protein